MAVIALFDGRWDDSLAAEPEAAALASAAGQLAAQGWQAGPHSAGADADGS